MYETRTVFSGHKIAEYDVVRFFLRRHEGKEGLIFHPFQLLAFEGVQHLDLDIAEDFLNQGLGKDQTLGAPLG